MVNPDTALAFVNTLKDRPTGRVESLGDPAAATDWLREELGYSQPRPLAQPEHERVRALRDGAQRVLRARLAGDPPGSHDLDILNRASAAAPRSERLEADWRMTRGFVDGGSTTPRDLTELLAALAGAVISLAADATIDLAECGADDCVVLFLRSDPRQRWHSERCGNRMRAARSYARHRSQRAEPSP